MKEVALRVDKLSAEIDRERLTDKKVFFCVYIGSRILCFDSVKMRYEPN